MIGDRAKYKGVHYSDKAPALAMRALSSIGLQSSLTSAQLDDH